MVRRDPRLVVPSSNLTRPTNVAPIATGKIGPVSLDRTKASPGEPLATSSAGDSRSQYYTLLTKIEPNGQPTLIYNGDRRWAKITLELEGAGPVSVGQQAGLLPVLGGQGVLLKTNEKREFVVAKGTRLYYAANGVNRVNVFIEPLPWLEQITGSIRQLIDVMTARLK